MNTGDVYLDLDNEVVIDLGDGGTMVLANSWGTNGHISESNTNEVRYLFNLIDFVEARKYELGVREEVEDES